MVNKRYILNDKYRIINLDEDMDNYPVKHYIKGEVLENYIKINGVLKAEEIYKIALSLCNEIKNYNKLKDSAAYLDLKPEDIMLVENKKVILINYYNYNGNNFNSNINFICTYNGKKEYLREFSIQNDLCNIGSIMYFMATGKLPYTVLEPLMDGNYPKGTSGNLIRIIKNCFEIYSSNKYLSIEEVKREIIVELLKYNETIKTRDLFQADILKEGAKETKLNKSKVKKRTVKSSNFAASVLGFIQETMRKSKKVMLPESI